MEENKMNTQVLTILNAEEMLTKMVSVIEGISKEFPHIKEEYDQALLVLRRELGDEKIKPFLDAINRRCEADLLFCGSLGYQANLNNFRDPVARTFMDVDFEEYLRVEVLQRMPQRQKAEAEIDAFYHALSDEQKGVYDAISSYLVSLELDLTKLAHYLSVKKRIQFIDNEQIATPLSRPNSEYFADTGFSVKVCLELCISG